MCSTVQDQSCKLNVSILSVVGVQIITKLTCYEHEMMVSAPSSLGWILGASAPSVQMS